MNDSRAHPRSVQRSTGPAHHFHAFHINRDVGHDAMHIHAEDWHTGLPIISEDVGPAAEGVIETAQHHLVAVHSGLDNINGGHIT